MKKLLTPAILFALCCLFSCQQEPVIEAEQIANPENEPYANPLSGEELSLRSSCPWIVIPAGSSNVLAQAIEDICEDGVIYFESGMHTETEAITISKPVKLIGADGAVLTIKSDLAPFDTVTLTSDLKPGLHVLDAPGTLIQDLEILPVDGDGGTAILIENSHGSAVMRCEISNFQMAIAVQKSDRLTIMYNTIVATSAWQTGEVSDAYNIVVINGKSNYISDNEVSNAIFGIWACDEWGTLERNNAHDNMVGIILCNVPVGYVLPGGEVVGAEIPATGWKVNNNETIGNFDNGIMIVDGSKNNRIWNNQAHGNGLSPFAGTAADIESFDDSYLFGFLTPSAHGNYVDATSDPNTTIRNCGTNNVFVGGIPIGGDCR